MGKRKVIIMGAAGRDFHNFNMFFRDNEKYQVVAFTATQIPNIEDRKYPAELAGKLYPEGIQIHYESELTDLIKKYDVEDVVFAYSDVTHEYVMHKSSIVNAAGANFMLLGPNETMVKSKVPVVSVCATRTGCGKSQTTRKVCEVLKKAGKKVVAVRHPMPYGDLVKQKVQRFAEYADLEKHQCTIEEMEEYEPHIEAGVVVYAGVDYEAILREAEKEADVVLWDGGNNDLPFFKPDYEIVVVDPHRVGHEMKYYPGEANFRRASAMVINKMDSAKPEWVEELKKNIQEVNSNATIIEADSEILFDEDIQLKGKKALVVEDGPTLTHGEMKYGAGYVAAERHGAEIIDPRPYIVGEIAQTYEKYPGIGKILPAMGYSEQQIKDLETTINKADCDVVVIGTPIDLRKVVKIDKPAVRVNYELKERSNPTVEDVLKTAKLI